MRVIPDDTIAAQRSRGGGQSGLRERGQAAPPLQQSAAAPGIRSVGLARVLLLISLLTGAISHGYHLVIYPLYITDEGIYMQHTWSVVHQMRHYPDTYY